MRVKVLSHHVMVDHTMQPQVARGNLLQNTAQEI